MVKPVVIDDANLQEHAAQVPMLAARHLAAKQIGKTVVVCDNQVMVRRSAFTLADGSTDDKPKDDGGFILPKVVADKIIKAMFETDLIRQIAEVR